MDESNTFLFVGGPWDGKRERVFPHSPYVKVASFRSQIDRTHPLTSIEMAIERAYDEHIYEMGRFCDKDGSEHRIYIHSSVSDPLGALIKGYRSNAI